MSGGNDNRDEAARVAEVILYVNVGLKPHTQVRDEMARFMSEVHRISDCK